MGVREVVRARNIGILMVAAIAGCGSSPAMGDVRDAGLDAPSKPSATSKPSTPSTPSDAADDRDAPASASSDAGIASIASACASLAQAYCSRFSACDPLDFGVVYGDAKTCEDRVSTVDCTGEFSSPGTPATPDNKRACAAAVAAQTCDDWLTGNPADCELRGSSAKGAGCEYDSQCQTGFCKRPSGSWCGTCQSQGAAGDTCDPNEDSCGSRLRCADVNCSTPIADGGSCDGVRTWSCVQPTPQGGSCVTPAQCVPGFLCENGTCSPGKQLGEPCENGVTCALSAALYCALPADGGAETCVQAVFVSSGASCAPGAGILCAASGVCRDAKGRPSEVGTCSPAAGDNQSCGATPCLPPAMCVNGQCQGPPPAADCQ